MIEIKIIEQFSNQHSKLCGESLIDISDIIEKKDFSITFSVDDDFKDAVLDLGWSRKWTDEEKSAVSSKRRGTVHLESNLSMVN